MIRNVCKREETMKIQYASDLHLEFHDNSSWLKAHPLQVTGDVLVLAGDVGYLGDDNYSKHPFWDWASKNYRQVIVVPGNHEFYKYFDIDTMADGWDLAIRQNVHCRYNAVVPLSDEIDLIATTLWSKIPIQNAYMTERSVSDFYRIMASGKQLDSTRFNEEHEHCFNFLKKAIYESKAKHIIVVTHHVPSELLTDPAFKDSSINGAFTVELFDFISKSPIEYWIYGHSHRNIDRIIGHTRCLSNQLGYVSLGEHLSFDTGKIFEI